MAAAVMDAARAGNNRIIVEFPLSVFVAERIGAPA
jgi:hypothetical protein